jgi:hypothetical protein
MKSLPKEELQKELNKAKERVGNPGWEYSLIAYNLRDCFDRDDEYDGLLWDYCHVLRDHCSKGDLEGLFEAIEYHLEKL